MSRARRYLIWAAVVVGLIAVYAAAGFWGVPRLIDSQARKFVAQHYGRELTLGEIRFNPFTLSLSIRDLSLPDADGAPMLAFSRLFVSFELASAWRRAASFREISLEKPFGRLLVKPDGSLNFAALALQSTTPTAPPAKASPPARVTVDRFAISDGGVTFEDRSRATPFRTELKPISFELRDFSTVATTGNSFLLQAASEAGERFRWRGSFGVNPLASQGHIDVESLQARTLWKYLRDAVGFEISSGTIGLGADYDFTASGTPVGLHLKVPELKVSNLSLKPRGGSDNYVDVAALTVSDTAVDLGARTVNVGGVKLSGGTIRSWLDATGKLNLLALAQAPAPSVTAAPAAPAPPAPPTTTVPAAGDRAWTVAAPDLHIDGLEITAEDRQLTPAAVLKIDAIDVAVAGFTTAPGAELKITAAARVNAVGKLALTGTVRPQSATWDAQANLDHIDLTALQPYIARATQMSLTSGFLSTKLHVERDAGGQLRVAGIVDVDRLRTFDQPLKQSFVRWDRLTVSGIDYRSQPASLNVAEVVARALYARVIVEKDRTVNISRILRPPGATPVAPAAAAPVPAKPHGAQRRASTTEAAVAAPPPTSGAAMKVSIKTIRVIDGSANYSDFWIQPNFAVGILDLGGTIVGLSSDPHSRARVDLKGKVDRYAPAVISGEINPFAVTAHTDIKMSFQGIDMSTVNPYSGHFAGYKIAKGKLSFDIEYKIDNRQLNAQHHIVIDQLQLGDPVASTDAVHLPLKIAVALLKDRNGVIDLDLPVTGSLDDPKFSLGPIIWKAVINLLVKVATAPFALLGHLFGGGEQMNIVDFAPGVATLDSTGSERMTALLKALKERPQLELDVPITYSPELDRPVLAARRLDAELVALKQPQHRGTKTDAAKSDQSILDDPAERFRLLVAKYRADLGKDAALPPETTTALAAQKKRGSAPVDLTAATSELEAALTMRIQIADGDLEALGKQRTQAVQDALLAGGEVDPKRVFVIDAPPKSAADAKSVRMELALK